MWVLFGRLDFQVRQRDRAVPATFSRRAGGAEQAAPVITALKTLLEHPATSGPLRDAQARLSAAPVTV